MTGDSSESCLLFNPLFKESSLTYMKTHKGKKVAPSVKRRKCLTKLFEVLLYPSPGVLLNYRFDKAPRLLFVFYFCRNPNKQNATVKKGRKRRKERHALLDSTVMVEISHQRQASSLHPWPEIHLKYQLELPQLSTWAVLTLKRGKKQMHAKTTYPVKASGDLNVQIIGKNFVSSSGSEEQGISLLWTVLILTSIWNSLMKSCFLLCMHTRDIIPGAQQCKHVKLITTNYASSTKNIPWVDKLNCLLGSTTEGKWHCCVVFPRLC